jgi:tRNA(Ile)-lysidine synthetase-like protein
VDAESLRRRVDEYVARGGLIEPGGEVVCLVSGGPDSTCLWHVLRTLGYDVSALHVDYGLRGEESTEDARFCASVLDAEVVSIPGAGMSEAGLREARYALARDRLRATGHTASDQVETVLYRLVASGTTTGMPARRDDGVVRPLLCVWRDETEGYCEAVGLPVRIDSSNVGTKRGLIRSDVLPLLRQLHPGAERNILAAAAARPLLAAPVERAFAELISSTEGSKRVDLGGGKMAVREYDRVWIETAPVRLDRRVQWGGWSIEGRVSGLVVRGWRSGDRLAGRRKTKVQDLFVAAKIPRSERESWPLVVRGDDVVAVPGIATAPGYENAVVAWKGER